MVFQFFYLPLFFFLSLQLLPLSLWAFGVCFYSFISWLFFVFFFWLRTISSSPFFSAFLFIIDFFEKFSPFFDVLNQYRNTICSIIFFLRFKIFNSEKIQFFLFSFLFHFFFFLNLFLMSFFLSLKFFGFFFLSKKKRCKRKSFQHSKLKGNEKYLPPTHSTWKE